MHNFHQHCRNILFICIAGTLISGCTAAEHPQAWIHEPVAQTPPVKTKQAQQTRLIIKFQDALSQSQVTHKLTQLGLQYHVRLTWVRAMSGDAFVITLEALDQHINLPTLLNRISQRPDVAYIEEDRLMHYQTQQHK